MLRASVAHVGDDIDVRALVSGPDHGGPSNIAHAAALGALADAAVGGDPIACSAARAQLESLGGADLVIDAAAVVANFEMMTRVADTTGAAIDERTQDALGQMISTLGADRFDSARWG